LEPWGAASHERIVDGVTLFPARPVFDARM
jgi:hypothetical protein